MADSFILFSDYADTIRGMSDVAAGILLKMIFNHVTGADELDGVTTEEGSDILDDASFAAARVAAGFITRQIDRSAEVYDELREKRREAGAKGAEKRWQKMANDGKAMANDSKPKQTEASDGKRCLPNPNPTPNPLDNKRGRFTPPTLEEVKAYCEERKSPVDPVRFYEYFQTGGWKDSKGNPVRNWKQKLITWEKHSETQPQKKQNQFLQFEQHEYDFDALEKELLQN